MAPVTSHVGFGRVGDGELASYGAEPGLPRDRRDALAVQVEPAGRVVVGRPEVARVDELCSTLLARVETGHEGVVGAAAEVDPGASGIGVASTNAIAALIRA